MTDVETEGVVVPAADGLEVVVVEARTAMLNAKMPKNCIFVCGEVLVTRCW